jgi:hypothetical protein
VGVSLSLLRMLMLTSILLLWGFGLFIDEETGEEPALGEMRAETTTTYVRPETPVSAPDNITTTTLAASVRVFPFTYAYTGRCSGPASGEIRVSGADVQLVFRDGATETVLGTTRREPDGSFVFDMPDAGLTLQGRLGETTVAGSGAWTLLGGGCTFRFSSP